jgi:hypothetical protein
VCRGGGEEKALWGVKTNGHSTVYRDVTIYRDVTMHRVYRDVISTGT